MYGLHFREQLPQVVADELDGLVAALRSVFYKEHREDGTHVDAAPEFALVPVGSIQAWPTSAAPDRWLICDGSAISRVTYNALYKVIGVTYGAGDTVLTFNLPNLRGRVPLGKASSGTGSTLAAVGGSIDHTHTGPSHTHTGPSHTHTGPSHTHTGPSHSHGGATGSDGSHSHGTGTGSTSTNVDANGVGTQYTASGQGHTHTTDTDGDHTHTISADGTGATGADGTGATGADGTGNTGSSGTGATGASNPPFLVINWIIFSGGAA